MTFLNPILALVGLACVAIPIVIHILMRRRRRPVAWGAMKFLMEAYRQQRRRTRLEQILLLASRCLLVALFALAIGKPILGALAGGTSGGPRTVYLVIDDTLASQSAAVGAAGGTPERASDFEQMRKRASDLLATLSQARGDRAAIVGVGSPARAVVMPPSGDLSLLAEALRQMSPTDARADWNGALAIVRDDQARTPDIPGGAVVALSAFRGGLDTTQKLTTLERAGAARLALLASRPGSGEPANVAIQAMEPARTLLIGAATGTEVEARVTLLRSGADSGDTPVRVRLRVFAGAAEIGVGEGNAIFAQGASTGVGVVRARLRTPPARGAAMVLVAQLDPSAGGAIAGDDVFLLPVEARERLEVALIAPGPLGTGGTAADFGPGDWAALALSPGSAISARRRDEGEVRVALVEPRAVGAGDGSLAEFDAAWVVAPEELSASGWRALSSLAQRGGLIIVTPPPAAQVHTWTDAMNEALGLDWTIARAATGFATPATISPERGGWSGPDLLGAVAGELAELVRPVRVDRALGVAGPADSFETLLWLDVAGASAPDAAALPQAAPTRLPLLALARAGGAGPDANAPTPAVAPSGEAIDATEAGKANAARGDGAGLVALLTVAPDLTWSDLPARPLMVPLVQELVRQGVGRSGARGATPAGQSPLLPPGTRELRPIMLDTGEGSPGDADASGEALGSGGLAVAGGVLIEPVRRRGLFAARDASGVVLGAAAFVADTQASATAGAREEAVERWLSSSGVESAWIDDADLAGVTAAGASDAASGEGTGSAPISTLLLIAAGLVALAEVFMARFFSHAKREDLA